jgi:hypothetical protein
MAPARQAAVQPSPPMVLARQLVPGGGILALTTDGVGVDGGADGGTGTTDGFGEAGGGGVAWTTDGSGRTVLDIWTVVPLLPVGKMVRRHWIAKRSLLKSAVFSKSSRETKRSKPCALLRLLKAASTVPDMKTGDLSYTSCIMNLNFTWTTSSSAVAAVVLPPSELSSSSRRKRDMDAVVPTSLPLGYKAMRQEWPPALKRSDLTYLPLPSLLASEQEPIVIVV